MVAVAVYPVAVFEAVAAAVFVAVVAASPAAVFEVAAASPVALDFVYLYPP